MGKGDIKSKRGKINNGSYGVRRPRKVEGITTAEIAEARVIKAATAAKTEKVKTAAPKKEAAPKAEKAPAAKKAVKAKA